ncbi:DUF1684 domain-containing protein [Robertkochia flava]|uniref:DUF1684 domain-containing protein n=1 Tax=Robertkochia flava TaxID=3447986 RepID=UPI001CCAB337|nr:DUF1684 domain-containing protein [Robertkochia marina]
MIRLAFFIWIALVVSCKSDKRYHDDSGVQEEQEMKAGTSYPEEIAALRAEKDKKFAEAGSSPLIAADLDEFTGLPYFPVDTTYKVEATLELSHSTELTSMPTTTDREVKQRVFGVLRFTLQGRHLSLKVYQDPMLTEPGYENYLFLPFTDQTNGEQTYGGGRYLDLEVPEGNRLTLDFNKAYNPYCAYNPKYSCPLVPRENHLDVAVKAGERVAEEQ